MDADELLPGGDTEKLPETYVIFITENDIYKEGLALYKIVSQMCKIMEDFAKEEITEAKMNLALKNLEKGLISENQISALYSLTQKQVAKVLEVYHSKVAVQA